MKTNAVIIQAKKITNNIYNITWDAILQEAFGLNLIVAKRCNKFFKLGVFQLQATMAKKINSDSSHCHNA